MKIRLKKTKTKMNHEIKGFMRKDTSFSENNFKNTPPSVSLFFYLKFIRRFEKRYLNENSLPKK